MFFFPPVTQNKAVISVYLIMHLNTNLLRLCYQHFHPMEINRCGHRVSLSAQESFARFYLQQVGKALVPSSVSHRKKTHFLSIHFTLPCYFNIPTLTCAEDLPGREIRQECGGHVLGGWLETAVCLRCVVFSSPPVGLLGLELRR